MPTSINLRTARTEDAEAVAKLSAELGYPASADEIASRLSILTGSPDHHVLVAESTAGEVVGWLHVFAAPRVESAPFSEIGGLVVSETHRGGGIGESLVRAAEEWARRNGHRELRVRSNVVRLRAHRFYERLGFRVSKSQAVFARDL